MASVTKLSQIKTVGECFNIPSLIASKVSYWKGDITKLEVDAIVNAANHSLLGGGGVDGAIHRAAGRELYEECRTLGGCKTGEAKITKAYNIKHINAIIHTVGPCVGGSGFTENHRHELISCYASSMKLAVENNLKSIAFPCISTGVYGYPNEDAASTVCSYMANWLRTGDNASKIGRIIFCVFLPQDETLYMKYLPMYFAEDAKEDR
ncbi:hypothetical protein AB6A40_006252 [Gnathostoma spinigerum]|uniref:Macro domain-containing protein n=1 Tax=Gnathostoma spinigerum TaxID=75299 RepID=A0ABD6ERA4_9BILA